VGFVVPLREVRETSTGFPVCAEMILHTRITQTVAILLSFHVAARCRLTRS
jgi:hypothetical protein